MSALLQNQSLAPNATADTRPAAMRSVILDINWKQTPTASDAATADSRFMR